MTTLDASFDSGVKNVDPVEPDVAAWLRALADARGMVAINPAVMGGAPCFVGTRLPVHDIADMRRNGDSAAELQAAYPQLDSRLIGLAVIYAAVHPRGRRRARTPDWRLAGPTSVTRVRLDRLSDAT